MTYKEEVTVDAVSQSQDWLLNIQRKLHRWSAKHPADAYTDLWNWIIDPRNLEIAFRRVALNKGANTPGIDGVTVKSIQKSLGEKVYLNILRERLQRGQFQPSAVKRKWIPKVGQPGKLRGLGIPTIDDRIVQSAIKQIIEPIFEARFLHVSNGFRPGFAVRDSIWQIRSMMRKRRDSQGKRKRPEWQFVIEGDIQRCFDEIDHHALMNRVRRGTVDRKVNRLITTFLKAGIMEEEFYLQTNAGTPQGGILSPLLANIALSIIEERYQRWVAPKTPLQTSKTSASSLAEKNRRKDRLKGHAVFFPVRYADDFIILCAATEDEAREERGKIAELLRKELGLTLSPHKTKITPVTEKFQFLGHQLQLRLNARLGWIPIASATAAAKARLRVRIKRITSRRTTHLPFEQILRKLNPIIRGWGNFYRHTSGAWKPFCTLDRFVFYRLECWLKKKHRKLGKRAIYRRYYLRKGPRQTLRWSEGEECCGFLQDIRREPWNPRRRKLPRFMHPVGEPGA